MGYERSQKREDRNIPSAQEKKLHIRRKMAAKGIRGNNCIGTSLESRHDLGIQSASRGICFEQKLNLFFGNKENKKKKDTGLCILLEGV